MEQYKVTNNEKEMQFEIELAGEKAYLLYRYHQNDIAFMHTVVPTGLEGRGIAKALAVAAFNFAEKTQKPVIVYCPFVLGFLKNHPEYNNQLKQQDKTE